MLRLVLKVRNICSGMNILFCPTRTDTVYNNTHQVEGTVTTTNMDFLLMVTLSFCFESLSIVSMTTCDEVERLKTALTLKSTLQRALTSPAFPNSNWSVALTCERHLAGHASARISLVISLRCSAAKSPLVFWTNSSTASCKDTTTIEIIPNTAMLLGISKRGYLQTSKKGCKHEVWPSIKLLLVIWNGEQGIGEGKTERWARVANALSRCKSCFARITRT